MTRLLLITDLPRTRAYVGFALDLLGVEYDVSTCLTTAALQLDRHEYDAAIIDLRWEAATAPSMTAWVDVHIANRGILPVLTAETPIARDMHFALRLKTAIFLGRNFDFKDVMEAAGAKRETAVLARLAG